MIIKRAQLIRLEEIYRSNFTAKVMAVLNDDIKYPIPGMTEEEKRTVVSDAICEADNLRINQENKYIAFVKIKICHILGDIDDVYFKLIKDAISANSDMVLFYETYMKRNLQK